MLKIASGGFKHERVGPPALSAAVTLSGTTWLALKNMRTGPAATEVREAAINAPRPARPAGRSPRPFSPTPSARARVFPGTRHPIAAGGYDHAAARCAAAGRRPSAQARVAPGSSAA